MKSTTPRRQKSSQTPYTPHILDIEEWQDSEEVALEERLLQRIPEESNQEDFNLSASISPLDHMSTHW